MEPSSSAQSQQLALSRMSFLKKLTIIPQLFYVLLIAAPLGMFARSKKHAPTYWLRYCYAAMRAMTIVLSPTKQLLFSPTDDEVIKKFSKKRGINLDCEVLSDGTTAFWVGNKDAKNIILQFHGGGFNLPMSEPLLDYMWRIKDALAKEGKDIGILNLAYDLLPTARYPRQLQQAAMILKHLITNLKKDPSRIVLLGDSSGANLALALLSHLNHPHPDQSIPRLNLSAPLQAAILVSAWISFKNDVPSVKLNEYNDIVTFPAATRWAEEYLNEKLPFPSSTEYTQARDASPEWWTGLPLKTVISVCSGDEGLADMIADFLVKLRIGLGSDRVIEDTVEGECHDAVYFIPMFTGGKEDSKMGQALEKRMLKLF